MEVEILKSVASSGPFAVLFVWFLIIVIKRNDERLAEDRKDKQKLAGLYLLLTKKYDTLVLEVRRIGEEVRFSANYLNRNHEEEIGQDAINKHIVSQFKQEQRIQKMLRDIETEEKELMEDE